MAKRIVILGAGYAGVQAALHLNKHGRRDGIEVTIVDRNPYHTLLTEIHEVAGHRQDEECMRVPLADIFRDTRVRVVTDEITGYDFAGKKLDGEKGAYDYDYCILAVGSSPAFYCIPGLEENAFTLWSLADSVKIRDHVEGCFARAAIEKDPDERRRLLTITVAGAGFTGVEMVGELGHWVRMLCRQHGIARKDVRLLLLDMMNRVLPTLDARTSAKAHRYMEKKLGVEMMLGAAISRVEPGLAVTDKGNVETRTLIWCAGVCCNESAKPAGLPSLNGSGRIRVDEFCRTAEQGVYAIGDCGALAGPDGKPYAAMVENALQTADGTAENILRDIHGKPPKAVKVKFHGIMVSIGNFFAVSDIMGKRLPSWMSLMMKFLVNAHYIYGILGYRGAYKYLSDEILRRRQQQFLLEKHYTQTMQAWWLAPLRVFLGAYWVWEGVDKVLKGWFSGPKLAEYLGTGFNRGYDVVTAATAAGQLRIENWVDININLVRLVVGEATNLVQGTEVSSQIFAKVDLLRFGSFNLVPEIINGWILSSQFWEMLFQFVVVIAEIGVGLLLMAGAFTFLSSLVSLGLLAMFVTSTGLYLDSWWMGFAGVAVMGGAGRAFGLDHYLYPWTMRVWECWRKNRVLKLFFPREGKPAGIDKPGKK